jgi:hypothetical protein
VLSRFWLTYCKPAGRQLFAVIILDSPSLVGARMRAAVEGIDQGAEFAEGHKLDGHRSLGAGYGDWPSAFRRGERRLDQTDQVRNPETACGSFGQAARSAVQAGLALQLRFMKVSESMGNHDSKIVDAGGVD